VEKEGSRRAASSPPQWNQLLLGFELDEFNEVWDGTHPHGQVLRGGRVLGY